MVGGLGCGGRWLGAAAAFRMPLTPSAAADLQGPMCHHHKDGQPQQTRLERINQKQGGS